MNSPSVSVVIIGRNEGERLTRCLRAVHEMNFPREQLEVIYVDSHSRDDSAARAAAEGAQVMVLPPGPTTAARGRNAGIRVARGDLLLLLDGDTIVAPEFLAHAIAFLDAHPDVAIYWGHRRELYPERSLYNRVFDLDWIIPCGETTFCGGDAVVRKRVLEDVGSFRDDLIAGEEPELCARIRAAGYRVWHADELMTEHDISITDFAAYWRRCYRGGHAYAEVADRTGGTLFRRESIKNHVQMAVYVLAPLALVVGFGRMGLGIALAAAMFMILRTAWRARWRKASIGTTLLYALHTHVCQVPIWLGQLAYLRSRRQQTLREIIEYK
jgi:glycosyltransferase involved in cell wall biosynthesis